MSRMTPERLLQILSWGSAYLLLLGLSPVIPTRTEAPRLAIWRQVCQASVVILMSLR